MHGIDFNFEIFTLPKNIFLYGSTQAKLKRAAEMEPSFSVVLCSGFVDLTVKYIIVIQHAT